MNVAYNDAVEYLIPPSPAAAPPVLQFQNEAQVQEGLTTEPPAPLPEECPGIDLPPSPPPVSNGSPGDVRVPSPDPDHLLERLQTEPPASPREESPRPDLPSAPPPACNASSVDLRLPPPGPPKFCGLSRVLAILW